jgi:acyl-CoA synthetase (AMP-forming)/AMP-acid ligase II
LIDARASATPMARMLIDEDGREITFVEYRAECERVAAGFQELGVKAGTAVSWQLPTWIESIVLVGALSRLGAVQNPILPIYREREVGFVVISSRQSASWLKLSKSAELRCARLCGRWRVKD